MCLAHRHYMGISCGLYDLLPDRGACGVANPEHWNCTKGVSSDLLGGQSSFQDDGTCF